LNNLQVNKMKKQKKQQRGSLTLLFTAIVLCILVMTVFIVVAIAFLLIQTGLLKESANYFSFTTQAALFFSAASLFVGFFMAYFFSKVPLKPVNMLINHLNTLSEGNYKIRFVPGKFWGRLPWASELSDSFNRLAAELDNTEVLRSNFINNFSHEFKTPIVSIAGFARLLRHGGLTETQQKEYLDIIEEESLRLSQMATNVLNLTKVENQTILTDLTVFNLSEQIRSCILLLSGKWEKKNLEFLLDFGEETICANEELLKQVWINLLDNAVKFSPENSVIEVHIDRDEAEDQILVSVVNSGADIPSEKQKLIFNKFYQAEESHAAEGNGVGLAVVKRVAELHSGSAHVKSGGGKTAFTVSLPKRKS